jgi:RNA polymerase sigma-70 factor (ECF subfamily)
VRDREERFDALYNAHYRAIYSYVYRRLSSQTTDVADTVAEVFTVAWRRLDDTPAGEAERLWLYGVAHRCVLHARRSDRRRIRLLERLTDEARTTSSTEPSSREEEVQAAIEQLKEGDREVLRLVLWEGLTHAQAAVVLDCSTNAVAQRLHAARERLRARLTEPSEISTKG